MKCKQPMLSTIEIKTIIDHEFYANEFSGLTEVLDYDDIKIYECVFKQVILHNSTIVHSDLMDVIFENCDCSNMDFSKNIFHRVVFKNCRMTGIDFTDCSFSDCQFLNCKLNLSNFSASHLKNCRFIESDASESRFVQTSFKNIEINHMNFNEAEFFHTSLKQLDFSTSEIYGISVTPESLKGIIVNEYQALALSKLLGIIIKE